MGVCVVAKGTIVNFPERSVSDQAEIHACDPDDLMASIFAFEQRLGGVNLSDLEDGDEEATRIATRSLRKEFMKLDTADLYRS